MRHILFILFLLIPLLSSAQEVKSSWKKALGSRGYDYTYAATLSEQRELYSVAYFETDSIYIKDYNNLECNFINKSKGTYLIKFDSIDEFLSRYEVQENRIDRIVNDVLKKLDIK